MKSIVVFGGSFNPPLNSHFSIAQEVLNQYKEVEKVVFLPVNQKYPKDSLIANEHRLNMLKLGADKNNDFIISDIDMYGDRSLYTIEILDKIHSEYNDKEIWFLMGSDNLAELYTWRNAEVLVSKYKFLVMERGNDKIEEIITKDKLLNCYHQNFKKLNQEIRSNYSSTYVRSQIQKGKSVRYLLPDNVYDYIEKNQLYRGKIND